MASRDPLPNKQNCLSGMARSLTAFMCIASLQVWSMADGDKVEPKKTQTASIPEPDPIDRAKSQFQHSQQQTKAFPEQSTKTESLAVPSFQMPGSSSLYEFLKQRKAVDKKKEKAQENWLVEGVMGAESKDKQAASKPRSLDRQGGGAKADTLKEIGEGVDGIVESKDGLAKIPDSPKKELVVTDIPQVDPFQQYMEKWMSAKDFDLLVRPSLRTGKPNPIGEAWTAPVGTDGLQAAAITDPGKGAGFTVPPSPTAPNPFLKAMENWSPVQAPQSGGFAPVQPSLVTEPEGLNRTLTQPTKMSQKELQGLFKPADDRKVFPQLKRF